MNLLKAIYRKIFPRYECRRCRDTLIVVSECGVCACGCPAAVADRQRKSDEFWAGIKKGWAEAEARAKHDL